MGDPLFLRSQISSPAFYQKHEAAILRAQADGRIVDDVTARKPPPKANIDQHPGHGRAAWIDTAGPRVEPPATETTPKPSGRSAGSDFNAGP